MEEIWKDIPNYEGLYQVSNLGNVKSLNHIRKNGTNEYMQRGRKLKPQKANNYLFVKLSKEGKTKQHFIHKLVAISFLSNELNYKDWSIGIVSSSWLLTVKKLIFEQATSIENC